MSYVDWIRSKVGTRKIFLVFAGVALRDANGRFLLQRRTDFDFWGLPGGVLELDETVEACARRELHEETGLTAGPLTLSGIYTDPRYDVTYPNGDQVQQFTICFTGQVQGGVMQPDGVETTAQAFFAPHELAALDIPVWYRAMLADAQRSDGPGFCPPAAVEPLVDQITLLRPFVGNDRIIAVGASVVLARDDGRLLVVQRRDNGMWTLPSGYANLGENVAQTAVREVCEETGYAIEPTSIMGIFSAPQFHFTFANGDQVKNVGVIFRARITGGQPRLQTAELRDMAWVTPAQLRQQASSFYQPLAEKVAAHLHQGTFCF